MQQTSASAAPASAPLPDDERPWSLAALSMLGGIATIQILAYAGITVIVPIAASLIVAAVLYVGQRRRSEHHRTALSLIGGHALWVVYDLAADGSWAAASVYAVIVAGLFLWLLLRPRVASFVVMGLWLLLQLAFFALALLVMSAGTRTHALIAIHAALLASSIAALAVSFVRMRSAGALRVALPRWLLWRRSEAPQAPGAGDTRDPETLLRDLLLQPAALDHSPPAAPSPEPRPPRRKPRPQAELSQSSQLLVAMAGAFGYQLFRSAGLMMLTPAALFFLIGIVLDRWGPPRTRPFAAAIGAAYSYLLLLWLAAPESAPLIVIGAALVTALAGALLARPLTIPAAGVAVALAGYALAQSVMQLDRYPAMASERDLMIGGDLLLIVAIIGAVVGCARAYDVPLRWRCWRDGQGAA